MKSDAAAATCFSWSHCRQGGSDSKGDQNYLSHDVLSLGRTTCCSEVVQNLKRRSSDFPSRRISGRRAAVVGNREVACEDAEKRPHLQSGFGQAWIVS
jgi:hypothetical protein